MEGQIAPTVKVPRPKAAHLMCGVRVWSVTGFVACAYLAYLSMDHVRRSEFDWPHDSWSLVTYGVWVLLMAGLLSETRCWRERIFFALVLGNFTLGFVLAVWGNVPTHTVRQARTISSGLWGLAALVSATTIFSSGRGALAQKKAS